jgi:tRNA(Leu) C34 or U34 (ribose-2'-O)-methylase TrmL
VREQVEERGDEMLTLQRGLLLRVASTQHPQGVLAVVESPCWSVSTVFAGGGPVVVLDRLQDPGNLGTLARSAEAAGASGVLRTRATVDPGNPKALRASAGSLLRLPSAEADDPVAAVRAAGLRLMAAEGRGGVPYDQVDLTAPFALLLGQEGSGLSGTLAGTADLTLTVPCSRPPDSGALPSRAARRSLGPGGGGLPKERNSPRNTAYPGAIARHGRVRTGRAARFGMRCRTLLPGWPHPFSIGPPRPNSRPWEHGLARSPRCIARCG